MGLKKTTHMNRSLRWILFLALTFGCQSETAEEKAAANTTSLYERLMGTWETTYIKVDIRSAENEPDSSYLFEIEEGQFERIFQVKPYRTYFAPDSTFRTVHRGIPGDIISEDKGLWNTFGDTLMLLQPDATMQFKVSIDKGMGHFTGFVDFDGDGMQDDAYYAIRRFVGKHSYE